MSGKFDVLSRMLNLMRCVVVVCSVAAVPRSGPTATWLPLEPRACMEQGDDARPHRVGVELHANA